MQSHTEDVEKLILVSPAGTMTQSTPALEMTYGALAALYPKMNKLSVAVALP